MVPLIEFDSTLPDDGTWTETDDIQTPSGRNVAEAIRRQFSVQGISSSAILQHSHYGWYWTSRIAQIPMWMMIQCGDRYILQLSDDRSILARIFRKGQFPAALVDARRALEATGQLHNADWYDRDLFNKHGPSTDAMLHWNSHQ
jgi:hypothetical protein